MVQRRKRTGMPDGFPYIFVMLVLAKRDRRVSAFMSTEPRGLASPPSRFSSVYSADSSSSSSCCFCSPVGSYCWGRGRRCDGTGVWGFGAATGGWEDRGPAVGWRQSGKRRCSRPQAVVGSTACPTATAAAKTGSAWHSSNPRTSCRERDILRGRATNLVRRSAAGPLGCLRRDEVRGAPCEGGERWGGGVKGGRKRAIPDWDRRQYRRSRKLTQLNAGRSDGEINGSRDTNGSQEVNGSLGNPSSAVKNGDDQTESAGEKNATEEPLPEAPRGMARKFWAALTSLGPSQSWDELDEAYAMMPDIQVELREKTGWEGTGAGYEDVRLGFFRDSNLKPMNWRDAVVSMKPGSGTIGLDPDFDDNAGSPAEVERRRRRRVEAAEEGRTAGDGGKERVGTRYGGAPPGSHGPWRWRQLVKGSALEKKLKSEIASFPGRLPRKVRRYYDDKVVWITGADHGVGEQLAINLTVNGARVILSGTDFDELERVQRLCILAWMKAINWELTNAILRGWTRLDRVMILPLDVRDEVFLERAHVEAVSMLDRPMDMVFHCQDEDVRHAGPGVGQEGEDQEDEEGLEAATDLEGAVALSKVLVPSMLDTGEGHIVVFSGGDASLQTQEGRSSATGVISSQQPPEEYFDGLREEVAQDGVKVTIVHGSLNQQPLESTAVQASNPKAGARARRASVNAGVVARKVLTSVSRGKQEVFLKRRGLLGAAAGLGARARLAGNSRKAPAPSP